MRSVSKLVDRGCSRDRRRRRCCAASTRSRPRRSGPPRRRSRRRRAGRPPRARTAVAPGVVVTRADYLAYARASADYTWDHREESLARWRATFDPASPFGYRAPGGLLDFAAVYAALYEMERNPVHAERAKQVLLTYGDYRSQFPESAAKARPDYSNGVPALPDFFVVMRYLKAYDTLHRLGQLTPAEAAKIEDLAAHCLDYLLQTSEWGAMNRTMLRAETLAWARAGDAQAPAGRRAGNCSAARSATTTGATGRSRTPRSTTASGSTRCSATPTRSARLHELFRTPEVFYYAQYFLNLMSPGDMVPDFGDAAWTQNWQHFLVFFETAAARLNDPEMKWAAQRIAARFLDLKKPTSAGLGCFLLDAYRWGRDDIAPRAPSNLSGEVMEDVQGKKVVFRNGWKPDSTYLLLTYRDEGDGGMNFRDYLRDSIPVEEEKMTHGHADENSISMLMSGGSLLLHDGGYRDYMPSGPFGAYRQDYFHNRLCVRPEKIWMGQKADEERYSQRGAIPAQGAARVPPQRRLVSPGPHAQGGLPAPARVRLRAHAPVRRRVGLRGRPGRRLREGPGDVRRLRRLQVEDRGVLHAGQSLAHAADPGARRALVRHGLRRRRDERVPGREAPARASSRRRHFRIEGVEPQKRHYQDEQTIYQAVARHFEPTAHRGVRDRADPARARTSRRRNSPAASRCVETVPARPAWPCRSRSARAGSPSARSRTSASTSRATTGARATCSRRARSATAPLTTDGDLIFALRGARRADLHHRQHDPRAVRRPGALPERDVVPRPPVRRVDRHERRRQGPVLAGHGDDRCARQVRSRSGPAGRRSTASTRLVRSFLEHDQLDLAIDGQRIRGYRTPDARSVWIRDHSDMMRGFRYFEPDLTSAVQHFADTQSASGRVFDYFTTFPEKLAERARELDEVRARAGRSRRRVPLRQGRLPGLAGVGRRRVDSRAAAEPRAGDGLHPEPPVVLGRGARPGEARLHHRHLGLRLHGRAPRLAPVPDHRRHVLGRDARRQQRLLRGVPPDGPAVSPLRRRRRARGTGRTRGRRHPRRA